MADDKKLKGLHQALIDEGYDMESYDDFVKNMDSPKARKGAYDALVSSGYDMEDFDQYERNIGYGVERGFGNTAISRMTDAPSYNEAIANAQQTIKENAQKPADPNTGLDAKGKPLGPLEIGKVDAKGVTDIEAPAPYMNALSGGQATYPYAQEQKPKVVDNGTHAGDIGYGDPNAVRAGEGVGVNNPNVDLLGEQAEALRLDTVKDTVKANATLEPKENASVVDNYLAGEEIIKAQKAEEERQKQIVDMTYRDMRESADDRMSFSEALTELATKKFYVAKEGYAEANKLWNHITESMNDETLSSFAGRMFGVDYASLPDKAVGGLSKQSVKDMLQGEMAMKLSDELAGKNVPRDYFNFLTRKASSAFSLTKVGDLLINYFGSDKLKTVNNILNNANQRGVAKYEENLDGGLLGGLEKGLPTGVGMALDFVVLDGVLKYGTSGFLSKFGAYANASAEGASAVARTGAYISPYAPNAISGMSLVRDALFGKAWKSSLITSAANMVGNAMPLARFGAINTTLDILGDEKRMKKYDSLTTPSGYLNAIGEDLETVKDSYVDGLFTGLKFNAVGVASNAASNYASGKVFSNAVDKIKASGVEGKELARAYGSALLKSDLTKAAMVVPSFGAELGVFTFDHINSTIEAHNAEIDAHNAEVAETGKGELRDDYLTIADMSAGDWSQAAMEQMGVLIGMKVTNGVAGHGGFDGLKRPERDATRIYKAGSSLLDKFGMEFDAKDIQAINSLGIGKFEKFDESLIKAMITKDGEGNTALSKASKDKTLPFNTLYKLNLAINQNLSIAGYTIDKEGNVVATMNPLDVVLESETHMETDGKYHVNCFDAKGRKVMNLRFDTRKEAEDYNENMQTRILDNERKLVVMMSGETSGTVGDAINQYADEHNIPRMEAEEMFADAMENGVNAMPGAAELANAVRVRVREAIRTHRKEIMQQVGLEIQEAYGVDVAKLFDKGIDNLTTDEVEIVRTYMDRMLEVKRDENTDPRVRAVEKVADEKDGVVRNATMDGEEVTVQGNPSTDSDVVVTHADGSKEHVSSAKVEVTGESPITDAIDAAVETYDFLSGPQVGNVIEAPSYEGGWDAPERLRIVRVEENGDVYFEGESYPVRREDIEGWINDQAEYVAENENKARLEQAKNDAIKNDNDAPNWINVNGEMVPVFSFENAGDGKVLPLDKEGEAITEAPVDARELISKEDFASTPEGRQKLGIPEPVEIPPATETGNKITKEYLDSLGSQDVLNLLADAALDKEGKYSKEEMEALIERLDDINVQSDEADYHYGLVEEKLKNLNNTNVEPVVESPKEPVQQDGLVRDEKGKVDFVSSPVGKVVEHLIDRSNKGRDDSDWIDANIKEAEKQVKALKRKTSLDLDENDRLEDEYNAEKARLQAVVDHWKEIKNSLATEKKRIADEAKAEAERKEAERIAAIKAKPIEDLEGEELDVVYGEYLKRNEGESDESYMDRLEKFAEEEAKSLQNNKVGRGTYKQRMDRARKLGVDVDSNTDADLVAARMIANGVKFTSASLKKELGNGFSQGETNLDSVIDDKNGLTIEQAAHNWAEDHGSIHGEEAGNLTETDIRNALISMVSKGREGAMRDIEERINQDIDSRDILTTPRQAREMREYEEGKLSNEGQTGETIAEEATGELPITDNYIEGLPDELQPLADGQEAFSKKKKGGKKNPYAGMPKKEKVKAETPVNAEEASAENVEITDNKAEETKPVAPKDAPSGIYDNGKRAKAEEVFGKDLVDKVEKYAKKMGIVVSFEDEITSKEGDEGQGSYVKGNRLMKISLANKEYFDPLRWVVGHETMHRVKELGKEAFDNFRQSVINHIGEDEFDNRVEKARMLYGDLSREALEEEVIADVAGDMFKDSATLEDYINPQVQPKENISAIKKLWNKVKDWWFDEYYGVDTKDIASVAQYEAETEYMTKRLDEALEVATAKDNAETEEAKNTENETNLSIVKDPKRLKEINKILDDEKGEGKTWVKAYHSMSLIDGKLYAPMNSMERGEDGKLRLGESAVVGDVIQADEHPERARWNGKSWIFDLTKANGKSVKDVAYDPYMHSSPSMLNDQFKEANNRPDLVTVEVRIPISELDGSYWAGKTKDANGEWQSQEGVPYSLLPTGTHDWHKGAVASKLTGTKDDRKVHLSRFFKVSRIIDNEEVGKEYARISKDYDIAFPINVMTPEVAKAFAENGGKVGNPEKGMKVTPEMEALVNAKTESAAEYRKRMNEAEREEKYSLRSKDRHLQNAWKKVEDGMKKYASIESKFLKNPSANKEAKKSAEDELRKLNKIYADLERAYMKVNNVSDSEDIIDDAWNYGQFMNAHRKMEEYGAFYNSEMPNVLKYLAKKGRYPSGGVGTGSENVIFYKCDEEGNISIDYAFNIERDKNLYDYAKLNAGPIEDYSKSTVSRFLKAARNNGANSNSNMGGSGSGGRGVANAKGQQFGDGRDGNQGNGSNAGKEEEESFSLKPERYQHKFNEEESAENKKYADAAKKFFGTTRNFKEAGYILDDGTMLDFSGRHEAPQNHWKFLANQRATDHRAIAELEEVKTNMNDFLAHGNVRIMPESGTINLSHMPSAKQIARLKEFVRANGGDVDIEFSKTNGDSEHYVTYTGASATKVATDISRYYEEGIRPDDYERFALKKKVDEKDQLFIDFDNAPEEIKEVVNESPFKRKGDATPMSIRDTFGFRVGGGFSNKQLNDLYDSFLFMSETLGISPKALSLGGAIQLNFNDRLHRSAARYSYKYNGSKREIEFGQGEVSDLAHEWIHALDNYLLGNENAKNRRSMPYKGHVSANMNAAESAGVRKEVVSAMRDIFKAMKDSGFIEQNREKANNVGNPSYWKSNIEMLARCMENYMVGKNGNLKTVAEISPAFKEKDNWKLHPTEEQMKTIAPAFDKFFETLQERTGANGYPELYSLKRGKDESYANFAKRIQDDYDYRKEGESWRERKPNESYADYAARMVRAYDNDREREKFSIKTKHGSGADFKKFDHKFMGTGEGAQAFGWGTYVSEVDGIARGYALSSAKGKVVPRINEIQNRINAILDDKGDPIKGHEDEYGNLIKERSLLRQGEGTRHLYDVNIPDDKNDAYIPWNENVSKETLEYVRAQAAQEGYADTAEIMKDAIEANAEIKGSALYAELKKYLDTNAEGVSKFLDRAGFVGMKVPTNFMATGSESPTHNYVIFNERNAKITDHEVFSLKGYRGARNMDDADMEAGRADRRFRTEAFDVAYRMEEEGKSPLEIKRATGWERGVDNKWKYETPDIEFDVSKIRDVWSNKKEVTLADVVGNDNEMFKAYPEMRNYKFEVFESSERNRGLNGYFDSDEKKVYLASDWVYDEMIEEVNEGIKNDIALLKEGKEPVFLKESMNADELAKIKTESGRRELIKQLEADVASTDKETADGINEILAHELQHAVQDIEGFARGGNPNEFSEPTETDKEYADFKQKFDKIPTLNEAKEYFKKNPDDRDAYYHISDVVEYFKGKEDGSKYFDTWYKNKLLSSLPRQERYKRLAGEIESRAVAERLTMSVEDRLNSLVSDSEDISREDADVRYSLKNQAEAQKRVADMKQEIANMMAKQTKKNDPKAIRDAVNDLTKFVRDNVDVELGQQIGSARIKSIMSQIQSAANRQDLEQPVRDIQVMLNEAEKALASKAMTDLLTFDMQGKNSRGVAIAKGVDEATRVAIQDVRDNQKEDRATYNTAYMKDLQDYNDCIVNGTPIPEELEKRIAISHPLRQMRIDVAEADADAQKALQDWQNAVSAIYQIKKAPGYMARRAQARVLAQAAQDVYIQKQHEANLATEQFNDGMRYVYGWGNSRLADWRKAKQDAKKYLLHNAMGDVKYNHVALEGEAGYTKENRTRAQKASDTWKSVKSWSELPMQSLDFMLQMVDYNHKNKEGFLYKYFMKSHKTGVVAAGDTLADGRKAYGDSLDEAVARFFPNLKKNTLDKMSDKSLYAKLAEDGREMLDARIIRRMTEHEAASRNKNMVDGRTDWQAGEDYEVDKQTKAHALYLWLTWRQPDGRMKLAAQGYDQNAIDQIEHALGNEYIEFGKWATDEFLPKLRKERYNPRHIEMYGTSMAENPHYFPLKLDKDKVSANGEFGKTNDQFMPSTITPNLIHRRSNNIAVDGDADAFSILQQYGEAMEQWHAMAPVVEAFNTLHASPAFRQAMEANQRGSFEMLMKAAQVATGSLYDKTDKQANSVNRIINKSISAGARAAIGFRLMTAIKQTLSYPAFSAYSSSLEFQKELGKNIFTPSANHEWAMQNLPAYRQRVRESDMGIEGMGDKDSWGTLDRMVSKYGMKANRVIDQLTVAAGARAVYNESMRQLLKRGVSQAEAHKQSVIEAEICYNESQQSSRNEFSSFMQKNDSPVLRPLTLFQNANIGYARQIRTALWDIGKAYKRHGFGKEGMKVYGKSASTIGVFGGILPMLWNLGGNTNNVADITNLNEDDKEKYLWAFALGMLTNGTTLGAPFNSAINGFRVSQGRLFDSVNTILEAKRTYGNTPQLWAKVGQGIAESGLGVSFDTWKNIYDGVVDLTTMYNTPAAIFGEVVGGVGGAIAGGAANGIGGAIAGGLAGATTGALAVDAVGAIVDDVNPQDVWLDMMLLVNMSKTDRRGWAQRMYKKYGATKFSQAYEKASDWARSDRRNSDLARKYVEGINADFEAEMNRLAKLDAEYRKQDTSEDRRQEILENEPLIDNGFYEVYKSIFEEVKTSIKEQDADYDKQIREILDELIKEWKENK